jgi:hypothetical protein
VTPIITINRLKGESEVAKPSARSERTSMIYPLKEHRI